MFSLKFWDNVLEKVNYRVLWVDLLKNKYGIDEDFSLAMGKTILK